MTRQILEADLTWTGDRFESGVQIAIGEDGRIASIEKTGALGRTPDRRLTGRALLPGMVSAHSHAFQRGLRGRGETFPAGAGNFWTWREAMYALVGRLDADELRALSLQTFREMRAAGITTVGEFHYVHHRDPDAARLRLRRGRARRRGRPPASASHSSSPTTTRAPWASRSKERSAASARRLQRFTGSRWTVWPRVSIPAARASPPRSTVCAPAASRTSRRSTKRPAGATSPSTSTSRSRRKRSKRSSPTTAAVPWRCSWRPSARRPISPPSTAPTPTPRRWTASSPRGAPSASAR